MSCGYACVGCGKCRGKPRELEITSVCFRCGHDNPEGASRCEKCGLELPRLPLAPRPSELEKVKGSCGINRPV